MHNSPAADFITLLPCFLVYNACRGLAIEYMRTEYGVDSSVGFSFRARTVRHTHKVTDATDHHTHASATAGIGHNINSICIQYSNWAHFVGP